MLTLAAAASAVTFAVQGASGGIHDFARLPFGWRLANAFRSYARYLLDAICNRNRPKDRRANFRSFFANAGTEALGGALRTAWHAA